MDPILPARRLSGIYDLSGLIDLFSQYDKNDDGVLSSNEIYFGVVDKNSKERPVTLAELMAERAAVFSPQKVSSIKALLDDPTIAFYIDVYGASFIYGLIDNLSKNSQIDLSTSDMGKIAQNTSALINTIEKIRPTIDSQSRFESNIRYPDFCPWTARFNGRIRKLHKTYRESAAAAREIISKFPNNFIPHVYFRLGLMSFFDDFNPKESWECFKEAGKKRYKNDFVGAQAYFYLGTLYLYAANDIDVATKIFKQALKKDPLGLPGKFPQIHYLSRMGKAAFLREYIIKAEREKWWMSEKKQYIAREYNLINGQQLGIIFDKSGRFVALVPGSIKPSSNINGGIEVEYFDILKQKTSFPVKFDTSVDLINSSLLRALIELPLNLLSGLDSVLITPKSGKHVGGICSGREITANTFSSIATMTHELLHLYFNHTLAQNVRALFSQISWNNRGTLLECDARDFLSIGENVFYSQSHITRKDGGTCDGDIYGMLNVREDFATFGENYFTNGSRMRRHVIEQSSVGNFEPVVKYLFFKHMVFDGREYGLSEMDHGINIKHAKTLIQEKSASTQTRKTTLDSFNRIYRLIISRSAP